jgi:hypothetical protein
MLRNKTRQKLIKSQLILILKELLIFNMKSSFPELRWSYDNSKNLIPKVEILLPIMEEVYLNNSLEKKYSISFNLMESISINTIMTASSLIFNTTIIITFGERILSVSSTSPHKRLTKDLIEELGFYIHRDLNLKNMIKIVLWIVCKR